MEPYLGVATLHPPTLLPPHRDGDRGSTEVGEGEGEVLQAGVGEGEVGGGEAGPDEDHLRIPASRHHLALPVHHHQLPVPHPARHSSGLTDGEAPDWPAILLTG